MFQSRFQEFHYLGFDILKDQNKFVLHYSVDNQYFFDPEYDVDLSLLVDEAEIAYEVFTFGLAEIPSFYKPFCTQNIIIDAGYLNSEQIAFWQNLYTKGLGEFFYRNQIDFRNLIQIESRGNLFEQRVVIPVRRETQPQKVLVPIGGGKDSIVTAEILKVKGIDFTWFVVEGDAAVHQVIKASGNSHLVTLGRNITKNFALIQKLNAEGFYNGHVPISSVFAFGAAILAKLHGFSHIAISQERSASSGNVEYLGVEINHQYSKSLEAERAIHEYILNHVSPNIYYFSILRHLWEIQIAQLFSQYPQYFDQFISCNRGQKQGIWCGQCAKCVFVWSILSPFLSPVQLEKIWKQNLFEKLELLPLFEEILGYRASKPWDCVGTFEEAQLALFLTRRKYQQEGLDIPAILQNLDVSGGEKQLPLLTDYNSDHLIPKEFLYRLP
jgi:7-cyano-7-deazaguanine synthase in queuosine biosynthesis